MGEIRVYLDCLFMDITVSMSDEEINSCTDGLEEDVEWIRFVESIN